jgi:hypothetical protein
MEMYKQASKLGLRFNTDKGVLSVEQLWSLNMTQLSSLIKAIKKVLKGTDNDDELSFLTESKKVDVENQLRFDIAKDIYLTLKAENDEARTKAEKKEFNQKILSLIAEKRDHELKNKSVEELEALINL